METLNSTCYVFQTDSEIVNHIYDTQNNYLIEYNNEGKKDLCAIYFSSNDIYFPNTEEIFRKRIIEKNFFEWYHSRIQKAYKQIFIRDVFKQWYLAGINKYINTPDKLIEFLKKETEGYEVITIGSSAGGYAAMLYGSYLNTKYILAFNPQFEIKTLLESTSEHKNPTIFRIKDERVKYFDITKIINPQIEIFYFFSNASKWDVEQNKFCPTGNIYPIEFKSAHHGIPFLKVALPIVINLENEKLNSLSKRKHHPIIFTIKMVGFINTIIGLYKQLNKAYKKRKYN